MALPYEPVAIALNIVFVAVIAFSSFKVMWVWRHRKWLALDFLGMGSSYLILMVWAALWFLTLDQTYFFLVAVWGIFWAVSYSYATLRMVHPHEKRPANWALLMYLSVLPVWLATGDMMLVALQILLLSALVIFVSSLVLLQLCGKVMKRYAVAGMLVGIIIASYVPTLLVPKTVTINITGGFLFFLPINALLAYLLFGFLQLAQKNPKEFICDYDHRKDGKRK